MSFSSWYLLYLAWRTSKVRINLWTPVNITLIHYFLLPLSSHHSQLPVQPGRVGGHGGEEHQRAAAGPSRILPHRCVSVRQHRQAVGLQLHSKAHRPGSSSPRQYPAATEFLRLPPVHQQAAQWKCQSGNVVCFQGHGAAPHQPLHRTPHQQVGCLFLCWCGGMNKSLFLWWNRSYYLSLIIN